MNNIRNNQKLFNIYYQLQGRHLLAPGKLQLIYHALLDVSLILKPSLLAEYIKDSTEQNVRRCGTNLMLGVVLKRVSSFCLSTPNIHVELLILKNYRPIEFVENIFYAFF